jgi:ribonuclease Z
MLKGHLKDFDINVKFPINFVPLKGNDPISVFNDKYVSVTAFPLKHRVPAFGFIFREKPSDRNIMKEAIEKYHIPTVRIPAIKKGEDFIAEDGSVIRNEEITKDPPEPLSYAYCSDTSYFRRLAHFVKGVSLLYHEATFDKSLSELAAATGHSTSVDAATTASNAEAKTLIIGHFSARYREISPLVAEAAEIFPRTIGAVDGETYDIAKISET